MQSNIPNTWKLIIKNKHINSTTDNTVILKISINSQYKDNIEK